MTDKPGFYCRPARIGWAKVPCTREEAHTGFLDDRDWIMYDAAFYMCSDGPIFVVRAENIESADLPVVVLAVQAPPKAE
jgi:hypothetical protein